MGTHSPVFKINIFVLDGMAGCVREWILIFHHFYEMKSYLHCEIDNAYICTYREERRVS